MSQRGCQSQRCGDWVRVLLLFWPEVVLSYLTFLETAGLRSVRQVCGLLSVMRRTVRRRRQMGVSRDLEDLRLMRQ